MKEWGGLFSAATFEFCAGSTGAWGAAGDAFQLVTIRSQLSGSGLIWSKLSHAFTHGACGLKAAEFGAGVAQDVESLATGAVDGTLDAVASFIFHRVEREDF